MASRETGERMGHEPIAIVGIGCRYPGGVASPARFWELLRDGVDAIGDIPAGRTDLDGYFSRAADLAEQDFARQGGFLPDIERFDAEFFGIAPREAVQLDPQQRLLLETAWEALEDAGLAQERLAGSRTGVYIGLWINDYEASLYDTLDEIEIYTTTGGGRYPAAGRLSFALDLRGPSLTVDTACSSSLVAVHLAVQSLRAGETDLSLAGGVNVILQPEISLAYARSGMLAADGRSKFGDARADGYVRSEGCGVVALKRLRDAQADGDPIYAVIRGSAVNNDGQGSGLLVQPSTDGQSDMLRKAYADAGVEPGAVGYVEAHGTGTLAGDPVELKAIGVVLGEGRPAGNRCLVGSVKTNFGHTEGAAGVAGLIKVALSLKHGLIPASLHFAMPSPRVPWDALPLAIPSSLTPWPTGDTRRYAGVSSFGITGTNAHIVLEEAPSESRYATATGLSDAPVILPISARSEPALRALASNYATHLRDLECVAPAHVAFTAATRRSHLAERLAVVAGSREALIERLDAFANGRPAPGIARATAFAQPPRLVFVFPGQGGQWLGMGLRLAATEPIFAAALGRCAEAIQAETGWSLKEVLQAPAERSRLDEIDVVQPTLFAIQVALAALLADWGLEPDVVVGHSLGEVAAAHVAGILSLEDAAAVICRRSRLLKRIAGRGAMGVVELPLADAKALLEPYGGRLAVAASNGPTTTVLAGDADALDDALSSVQSRGGFARRVQVDVASHSPHVEPLLAELETALAGLEARPARTEFASTVRGELLSGPELGASYWAQNLRQPVLFGPVIAQLLNDGETAFLELSPHPVLLGAVEGAARAAGSSAVAVGALHRAQDEAETLREAIGALWAAGVGVDWKRVAPGQVTLPLPSYPWQRKRLWFSGTSRAKRSRAATSIDSQGSGALLGAPLPALAHLPGSRFWQGRIEPPDGPSVVTVADVPLVPGAAAGLMASAAGASEAGCAVERLVIEMHPLLTAPLETQTVLTPLDDHTELRLFVRDCEEKPWALWATARTGAAQPVPATVDVAAIQARMVRQPNVWQGVGEVWRAGGEALAHLTPPAEGELEKADLLEAASRLLGNSLDESPELLVGADFMVLYADIGDAVWAHAIRRRASELTGDLVIMDGDGAVLAELQGVRQRAPDDELLLRTSTARLDDWLYALEWRTAPEPDISSPLSGEWLILSDANGLGARLASSMERRGVGTRVLRASTADSEVLDHQLCETVDLPLPEYTGIIDLRALDVDDDGFPRSATSAWGPALALAQTLAHGSLGAAARLWLVTRGAQAVGGPPSNLSTAGLWGLGRVVANEYPEHWGGLIDLDPTPSAADAELLCNAVLLSGGEDEIALRGNRRLVARVARRRELASHSIELCPDASYLITGGAGGIGQIVARWMASSGARHLVLVGRRPLDAVSAAVSDLEAAGARVTYLRGDIACAADVADIFATIAATCPPLRGIVHCAAETVDATLLHQTNAGFSAVFGPKASGAWNLAAASRELSLDFLALFSSIGALLGLPGLANYVAVNATVDALAYRLRAEGLPATSIAWGHWHDVGLAARTGRRESFERRGLASISPLAGTAALGRVLPMDVAHLAVANMDWARYLAHSQTVAPRFIDLAAEVRGCADACASPALPHLRERLAVAAPADRRDLLLESVRAHAAAVLHVDDMQRISPRRGFNQMGMDSLLAVELKNRLQQLVGLNLPPTVAFDYPTPVALAQHLLDELFPSAPASQPTAAAEAISLPDLSPDELRDLMAAELQLIDKELGS